MKKLISILLSISLLCNMMPQHVVSVFAEDVETLETQEVLESESSEESSEDEKQDSADSEMTEVSEETENTEEITETNGDDLVESSEETEISVSEEETEVSSEDLSENTEEPQEQEDPEQEISFMSVDGVAVIEGESYSSLNEAIQSALAKLESQDEVLIQLESDINESIKISSVNFRSFAGTIRLDLNGHTWSGNAETTFALNTNYVNWTLSNGKLVAPEDYRAFEVEIKTVPANNPVKITMKDLVLEGNGGSIQSEGKITIASNSRLLGGIAEIFNADLTMENCVLQNGANTSFGSSSYGGALAVATSGGVREIEIRNSKFVNNLASYGGALVAIAGTSKLVMNLTIENTEFTENTATYYGGAIRIDFGSMNTVLNNNRFERNQANNGGAIYASYGTLKMNDNILKNNASRSGDGGAVRVDGNVTELSVSRGEMIENTSATNGGALSLSSPKNIVRIQDVYFRGNTAGSNGGGLYATTINKAADFVIENSTFEQNHAKNGGGFYASGSSAAVKVNGTFTENSASVNGGGLYLDVLSAVVDSKIEGNTSENLAGGFYFTSTNSASSLTLKGSVINNTAQNQGGGVYAQMRTFNLEDAIVTKNTANGSGSSGVGGGLWLQTSGKYYGEYNLIGNTHIYDNRTPNEAKKANGSIGASSEILVRNTNVATTSAVSYAAKLTGFDDQVFTDEMGTQYILTKYSSKFSTAKPAKFYSGYYSEIATKKELYLDPNGEMSEHVSENDNVFVAKTLEEAYEIAKREDIDQITVCASIQMGKNEEQYINDASIVYTRCEKHPNVALLNITEEVTLKGAQIDGLNIESTTSLISVRSGNFLIIEEGTLIQNGNNIGSNGKNGVGGAIVVNGAKMNMNGGLIRNNYASSKGGAIFVQQGVLNVEGGTISYNSSNNYGGGIDAFSKSEVNIGVNGGRPVLDHNTSVSEGGGICFESTTTGKIYSAEITNNQSTLKSVYVSGSAVSVQSGASVLMKNVYVSENMGENYGAYGALYTCPTGETALFEVSGALIVDNNYKMSGLTRKAPDIFHAKSKWNNMVYVSDEACGGGEIEFEINNGTGSLGKAKKSYYQYTSESFSIRSIVSEQTKLWAKEKAQNEGVVITGNIGNGPGSAIANNGYLTIGTEAMAMRVEKKWQDENGNVVTDHPDQVLLYLTRNGEKVDTSTRKDAVVVLSKSNGYSYTWRNLDPSQEWSVLEASMSGYEYQVGEMVKQTEIPAYLATDEYYIRTLTNVKTEKETGSVTLKKEVFSQDTSGSFEFIVKLSGEGEYSYYTSDDETLKPIFDKNDFHLELKNGESVTFVGLSKGSTFTVEEADYENYLTYINGQFSEDHRTSVQIEDETEIVFSYKNIEKTDMTVNKSWIDGNDQYGLRPEFIEVILLQNGSEYLKGKLSEDTQWQYQFESLPKYDLEGNEYSYTLKEAEVQQYQSEIQGHEIKNTLMTKIHIKKEWEDEEDSFAIRPEKIQIDLIRELDGQSEILETIELSEENADENGDWIYTVEDLPLFNEENKEYSYRLEETFEDSDRYFVEYKEADIDENAELTLTVVNTLKMGEVQLVKNLKRYNAASQASFIFSVEARLNGELLYSNILSLDFEEAGQKSLTIGKFPVGTEVKIEEVYSGSSYELVEGDPIQIFVVEEPESSEQVSLIEAEFTNDYNYRLINGSSLKNNYIHKEDESGNVRLEVIQGNRSEAE